MKSGVPAMRFSFAFSSCSRVIFLPKVETYNIKVLSFRVFKGQKFLKRKHIKSCLINILMYDILEAKKSRFPFTTYANYPS